MALKFRMASHATRKVPPSLSILPVRADMAFWSKSCHAHIIGGGDCRQ